MILMITDAKDAFNHLSHPSACPDVAAISEGFGTKQQELWELRTLLMAHPRFSPFCLASSQPLHSCFFASLDPLAHRSFCD